MSKTDLSCFVEREAQAAARPGEAGTSPGGFEHCEFFLDPQGHERISARDAQWLWSKGSALGATLYHRIYVIVGEPIAVRAA